MQVLGRYDGNLQMFVEDNHAVDMQRLCFLRWLGEQGRLEHLVAGPSSGSFVRPSVLTTAELREVHATSVI